MLAWHAADHQMRPTLTAQPRSLRTVYDETLRDAAFALGQIGAHEEDDWPSYPGEADDDLLDRAAKRALLTPKPQRRR